MKIGIEVEDKAYEGAPDDVKTVILTTRTYVSQFLFGGVVFRIASYCD